jgi:hypothetical protein
MARVHDEISPALAEFVEAQPVFFVGTAPLAGDGHVNVSPKGLVPVRVLDPRTVAYLDLTGSGIETVAHLRENGRITLMFCAFWGRPDIVRLYGRGEAVRRGDPGADALFAHFPDHPGARAVVRVTLDRISSSCGFGVPRLDLVEDRDELVAWATKKTEAKLEEYRTDRNATSIDGLPGWPR